jgi:molybdenum cofactor synthesis domain-containing protein
VNAAVLTVSDRVSRGEAQDASGDLLEQLLRAEGYAVARRVVPDEADEIAVAIEELAAGAALVLTTGGTGLAPRDVTPEATRSVIDREAPGIAEAMRATSLRATPMGMLSRGMSGVAHRTLIVNFPGNPKAIEELFPVIAPVLRHAAETLVREGGRAGGH